MQQLFVQGEKAQFVLYVSFCTTPSFLCTEVVLKITAGTGGRPAPHPEPGHRCVSRPPCLVPGAVAQCAASLCPWPRTDLRSATAGLCDAVGQGCCAGSRHCWRRREGVVLCHGQGQLSSPGHLRGAAAPCTAAARHIGAVMCSLPHGLLACQKEAGSMPGDVIRLQHAVA